MRPGFVEYDAGNASYLCLMDESKNLDFDLVVCCLESVQVIVVPLFAGLSGAKISRITWIAAATALVGVGILESNGTPFAVKSSKPYLPSYIHHFRSFVQR